MIDFILRLWSGIQELGAEHNVDPFLFAILYLGTIPPYLGSMIWAVRNFKKGKGIALPVLSTAFFFILPALYVILFGENMAWWAYAVIVFIVVYGSFSGYSKFKKQTERELM